MNVKKRKTNIFIASRDVAFLNIEQVLFFLLLRYIHRKGINFVAISHSFDAKTAVWLEFK